MKERLQRVVGERAAKLLDTPDCIKALKPDHKGVILCMDKDMSFDAYYPAGKPTRSQSYSYTGPNARASNQLQALSLALDFLWSNHKSKDRDTWIVVPSILLVGWS